MNPFSAIRADKLLLAIERRGIQLGVRVILFFAGIADCRGHGIVWFVSPAPARNLTTPVRASGRGRVARRSVTQRASRGELFS